MNYLKLITVEPSVLTYQLVFQFLGDLNANLFLQKSCRFDRTHEPDLSTKCDDEKQGVLFVSEANLKYSSIVFLLNGILSTFALPWSDKAGRRRRPLMFIAIIGVILQSLLGLLHSYFWQWEPIAAVISNTIIGSMTGGPLLMTLAWQVYICDISEAENRTARLGFGGAVRLIGLMLGKGGSGIVLRKVGFYYSYLVCLIISTFSLICGSILIKNTSVVVEKEIFSYRMVSNIGHDLIDSFKVVFRKTLPYKRIVILLLLMAHVAINFTYFGELSVLYQYLRYRFQWTEREYSEYMFYKFSTSTIGVIFCSLFLSKYLKLHDGLIGILVASFDTLAVLGLLLATQSWQMYLIPLIDVFHGTSLFITTSFMSKYYHVNDLGKLSAVIGVAHSLPSALSYPAYNGIYIHTLDTFSSAFCLLSIALNMTILVCFCGTYVLSKKLDKNAQESTVKNANPEDGDDATTPLSVSR